MKVYRYTTEAQKKLKSKLKAEPWMHLAFRMSPHDDRKAEYVIYVLDTRQVLEEGPVPNYIRRKDEFGLHLYPTGRFVGLTLARDNGKDLVGAKGVWPFDADDMPMQPLKIEKPYMFSGGERKTRWYVDPEDLHGHTFGRPFPNIRATINGVNVEFNTEPLYSGLADGIRSKRALIDGKHVNGLFANN